MLLDIYESFRAENARAATVSSTGLDLVAKPGAVAKTTARKAAVGTRTTTTVGKKAATKTTAKKAANTTAKRAAKTTQKRAAAANKSAVRTASSTPKPQSNQKEN